MVRALTLALLLWGCDGRLKHHGSTTPELLDDGWPVGSVARSGLDADALDRVHERLLDERHFPGVRTLLVVKDGTLVSELLVRTPADRDRPHSLMSVTKSVTSMLWGIANDRGQTPPLDTPLCDVLDGSACAGLADERKRAITLRHLLMMRSGLDFENVDFSREQWVGRPADPIRAILDKPLFAAPGEQFRYRDCDPQLLGYALERVVGQSEARFAADALFAPLGITDAVWNSGPIGESMAAHGLYLRPRDLAKLGQVMLDDGRWQGRQLVSSAWRSASTTPLQPSNDPPFDYGFYWYVLPDGAGFAAWGSGGQYVLAFPRKRLLVVMTSAPDSVGFEGGRLEEVVALTEALWR